MSDYKDMRVDMSISEQAAALRTQTSLGTAPISRRQLLRSALTGATGLLVCRLSPAPIFAMIAVPRTHTTMKVSAYTGKSHLIPNPTPEMIRHAVDNLTPVTNDFIIMVAERAVQNCEFVQTKLLKDENEFFAALYVVEAGFQYCDGRKHFRRFTSGNEVKQVLKMFTMQILPNFDHWEWEDVTEEVFPPKQSEALPLL